MGRQSESRGITAQGMCLNWSKCSVNESVCSWQDGASSDENITRYELVHTS